METLMANGPYAYTKIWDMQIQPDGTVSLPITTTREGVFDGYTKLHQTTRVLSWRPLVEVHGEWYSFQEGIVGTLHKPSSTTSEGGVSILLFPVGSGRGITGELVWSPVPRDLLGVGAQLVAKPAETNGSADKLELRRQLVAQHEGYLEALRSAQVDGVLEAVSVDAQAAIRDYVNDTGTLIKLEGRSAHQSYYEALFDKYEVQSVDLLRRVAQDWYLFAEVRLTVNVRGGRSAGQTLAFHAAEYFVPGHDGRFVVRVGHGTDPA
jgi:hypothetical protein